MITTRDLSLIRVRPAIPVAPAAAASTVPAPGPGSTTAAGGEPDTVATAPEDGVEILPRS